MEVSCQNCNAKINVPDEKIPPGKTFSFNCPSCKGKITVKAPAGPAAAGETPSAPTPPPAAPANESAQAEMLSASSEKPGALICHNEPAMLKSAFQARGYQVHVPGSHADANKSIRFNDYKAVIITEEFEKIPHDGPSVLESLQGMSMDKRRRMFVAYIGSDVKTGDSMAALAKSVDTLISSEDLQKQGEGVADILQKAIYENDLKYKVYFETMKAQGKV